MITSFKFENCFAFNQKVEMTLRADMRTKKFYSNITKVNNNLNIMISELFDISKRKTSL